MKPLTSRSCQFSTMSSFVELLGRDNQWNRIPEQANSSRSVSIDSLAKKNPGSFSSPGATRIFGLNTRNPWLSGRCLLYPRFHSPSASWISVSSPPKTASDADGVGDRQCSRLVSKDQFLGVLSVSVQNPKKLPPAAGPRRSATSDPPRRRRRENPRFRTISITGPGILSSSE